MSASLAFRMAVAAVAIGVLACNEANDPTSPAPAPPPPPPAGTEFRWSDQAAWPNGQIPVSGAAVTIPAGRTVLLDVSPPPLASLTVEGTLRFDSKDLNLTTGWILVHSGRFEIGSEAAPYTHHAVITLTGPATDNIMGMGAKVLGAIEGGAIELHGEKRLAWTRLSATAGTGSTQLQLERTVDWRVGDHLVIASTDFEPRQAEELTVTAVQGSVVTHLPGAQEFTLRHYPEPGRTHPG